MDFYKGTHGTSRTAAEHIGKEGFRAGPGIRGCGTYFWLYQYDELLDEAENLAIYWWRHSHLKGSYSKDKDKDCAVILADLNTCEDDIFDLERRRQSLMKFYQDVKDLLDVDKTMKEEERNTLLSGIHDLFVEKYEEKSGKKYCAVQVRVPEPNKFKSRFNKDIQGQPLCLVVRNHDIIDVKDIKHPDISVDELR